MSSQVAKGPAVRYFRALLIPNEFTKLLPYFWVCGKSETLIIGHFSSNVMEVLSAFLHRIDCFSAITFSHSSHHQVICNHSGFHF